MTQPPEENPFSTPSDDDGVQLTPEPAASTPPPPPPPPPPAAYGAPAAPAYGAPGSYGAPAVAPQNTQGIIALVTGILSLICCGFIFGVVAIITGRNGMRLAAEGRANNGGLAKAGLVLGIIGLVLWALWLVYAIAKGSWSFSTGTST